MAAETGKHIEDVRNFWNSNPLFTGESHHAVGSHEYFEEHRRTVIQDCLAGQFDDRLLPPSDCRDKVLDLGCGPGFWSVELQLRCPIGQLVAGDLTPRAAELAQERLRQYKLPGETQVENAEKLSYADGTFSHVNCQGVVHHTPDTGKAVAEIARVIRPGGSASISVCYRNWLLRVWPRIAFLGRPLQALGIKLAGRQRETMLDTNDVEDMIRMFDGADNPIGKAYTDAEFRRLLDPHFEVLETYFHFFPARALPFRLPMSLHRLLDRWVPFMIYYTLRKR